ncbi:stage II sporulation protein P [Anoxybacillus flavithermus]|nr:stage II sporulation protein P [Anoxybacillus flavithermus]MBE2907467.1 stage II sporulation protein P [Anoxybacillus flavithermus]MBE2909946.1 stage II sporulation protein P [Anoxybacillus flavithermus]MBE2912073.1 stage II sporulation protein P [Anoxybacillus flavithermus]MBE2917853.1 stage II sporulation protein P [Anoxybacillus flavithermus]
MNMMVTVHGTSIKKWLVFILFTFMGTLTVVATMTATSTYRLSSSSVHEVANHFSTESLVHLLSFENVYFSQTLPKDKQQLPYSQYFFQMTTSVNLNDPRSLLGRELPGFSLYDSEIILAGEGTDFTNIPYESPPPLEVLLAEREAAQEQFQEEETPPAPAPSQTTGGKKVAYIYHTHTQESYLPALKGVTNPNFAHHPTVNVTKVGKKLGEELEKRGIGTVVDTTDFIGKLLKNNMEYYQAYDMSRKTVVEAMANNRDVQYLIDIHRDSRRRNDTTVTINGVHYARVSFIIGGENAKYKKNLQLVTKLHELLEKKYPGLSRGTFEKKGVGTNGKFNQDLSENAILIEFGGVDNTFQELYRTAAAVADVFSEYYWQAEKVNATQPAEKK